MRELLLQLADAAEKRLGVTNSMIAIVVMHRAGLTTDPIYQLSIGCESSPALLREMRSAFPSRSMGAVKATMGPRGALDLVNLRFEDVHAALARYGPAGNSN